MMKILKQWGLDGHDYSAQEFMFVKKTILLNFIISFVLTNLPRLLNFVLFKHAAHVFIPYSFSVQVCCFLLYAALQIFFLIKGSILSKQTGKNLFIIASIFGVGINGVFVLCGLFLIDFMTIKAVSTIYFMSNNMGSSLLHYFTIFWPLYLFPLFFLSIAFISKKNNLAKKFNPKADDFKRSTYGSAEFASKEYLKNKGAFENKPGRALFGKFESDYLYWPLCNRLIIAGPGGGKSSSVVIPALLTEDRPFFILDPKAELWAVAARQRLSGFKRKLFIFDPFKVRSKPSLCEGKSEELMVESCLNLFDYLPDDAGQRSEFISSLSQSLIVREATDEPHFIELATMIIEGLIDYVIKTAKNPSFAMVYDLLNQDKKDMKVFANQLLDFKGPAMAAGSIILNVGDDEYGSLYSTMTRQFKWVLEYNLNEMFSHSNCDLREFIRGEADIFIIIPPGMLEKHSRVLRMIFATITNMIERSDPKDMPQKKFLFVLEELAQIGYSKDVEKAIEILRSSGVVLWAIFQTLKQLQLYPKWDLFTDMDMLQLFHIGDLDTLKWLVDLSGQKTILVEHRSTNEGKSSSGNMMGNGSSQKGEGDSFQEAGVGLIKINEMRELPRDKQVLFIKTVKAIRCTKLHYLSDPLFKGKFDLNPLEIERL